MQCPFLTIFYIINLPITFYIITAASYYRRKGDLRLKITDLVPTLSQNSSVTLIKTLDLSSFYFEMEILLRII